VAVLAEHYQSLMEFDIISVRQKRFAALPIRSQGGMVRPTKRQPY
jgi:hypothetical protein